jgi:hypothetical protein
MVKRDGEDARAYVLMSLSWQLEYGFVRGRKREFIVSGPSLPPARRGMLVLTATRSHRVM